MLRRMVARLGKVGFTTLMVAIGIMIVGVAFALVTVSISGTVASNEFATTTTAPTTTTTTLPTGSGLRAAISTNGISDSACQNAIDTGSLSLGATSFDLNNTSAQSFSTPSFLCVTNTLSGTANEITTLTAQVSIESTTEDACSDDEKLVDPEGPTDCGVAGELGDVIDVVLNPASMQDPGCFSNPLTLDPSGAPVSLLFPSPTDDLTFGLYCVWEVRLRLDATASYESKLAASTDGLSLTLDVSGDTS